MKCPKCGSREVTNKNAGQCRGHRRIGGIFHNTCDCGCRFTTEAGGFGVTKHGNQGKGSLKRGSTCDL